MRYLGHSNFAGWQLAEAAGASRELGTTGFVSAQNHWSLLERGIQAEVVPAALHYGLGVLPYYPLANGLLTGKVRRGLPPPEGSRLASRPDYITATSSTGWRSWPTGPSSTASRSSTWRSAGWPPSRAARR